MNIMTLGLHKGRTYDWIRDNEPDYCKWVINLKNPNGAILEFQEWLKKDLAGKDCHICNGQGWFISEGEDIECFECS